MVSTSRTAPPVSPLVATSTRLLPPALARALQAVVYTVYWLGLCRPYSLFIYQARVVQLDSFSLVNKQVAGLREALFF